MGSTCSAHEITKYLSENLKDLGWRHLGEVRAQKGEFFIIMNNFAKLWYPFRLMKDILGQSARPKIRYG
jgi:hypothetical protein